MFELAVGIAIAAVLTILIIVASSLFIENSRLTSRNTALEQELHSSKTKTLEIRGKCNIGRIPWFVSGDLILP